MNLLVKLLHKLTFRLFLLVCFLTGKYLLFVITLGRVQVVTESLEDYSAYFTPYIHLVTFLLGVSTWCSLVTVSIKLGLFSG